MKLIYLHLYKDTFSILMQAYKQSQRIKITLERFLIENNLVSKIEFFYY